MSAPLVDLGGHSVNIGNSSVDPPLTQDVTTILLETIVAIIGIFPDPYSIHRGPEN